MNIKALAVKGYGPFLDKTVFEFKPGVSVIYGLNQSSGKFSRNSNWVGKSLFFNSLSELLYDEPIVGLKSDKVKHGTRAIILGDESNGIQIIKSFKGKKESTKIIENGKEIEHLTKTKANEYIASKWGFSRVEYESFIHIDSRVPHPLVMGSSTDRKNFFDNFFRLDAIDAERRLYISALRKLESVRNAYKELTAVYTQQVKSVVADDDYEQLLEDLEYLKTTQLSKQKQFNEVQTYQSLKKVYDRLEPHLQRLSSICELQDVSDKIKQLKAHKAELDAIAEQVASYKAYINLKQDYDGCLQNLSDFAKSTSKAKLKKGSEYYTMYKSKLSIMQDELDLLEEVEPVKKPTCEKFDLVECLASKANIEQQLRLSLKFKSGVCPTCNQPVKTKSVSSIKQELYTVEKQIMYAKQWEHYNKHNDLYITYKQKTDALSQAIHDLETKVQKYKKYNDAFNEIKRLPSEPQPVDKPSLNPKQLKQKYADLQNTLDTLVSISPHVDTILQYQKFEGCKTFDTSSYNKLNEQIARIEAKVQLNKTARQSLKHTTQRLKELKEQLKDEQALKTLVELFSDKQIKKVLVTQISDKLCSLLNKYALLVFNEDYTFDLIWDTQLQLICTRKVGKQTLVSDVRKLSGAESKLFTLIMLISLLSFLPHNKRPKILILDEPTANLSAETTQAFMKLVDILKTVIPSIVIITPKDDVYPGSMPYTVVRTKKGSTLVEGFPDEIRSK